MKVLWESETNNCQGQHLIWWSNNIHDLCSSWRSAPGGDIYNLPETPNLTTTFLSLRKSACTFFCASRCFNFWVFATIEATGVTIPELRLTLDQHHWNFWAHKLTTARQEGNFNTVAGAIVQSCAPDTVALDMHEHTHAVTLVWRYVLKSLAKKCLLSSPPESISRMQWGGICNPLLCFVSKSLSCYY